MNERVKELRKLLNLSQDAFSSKINISRSHYALIEGGNKNLTDRVISDICREFNVNEEWLRNGTGEMFIEPDTFSLDEYAKVNQLTSLELDIIKGYMDLDNETRNKIMLHFKAAFAKHTESEITATKEYKNSIPSDESEHNSTNDELLDASDIVEVEAFKSELIATKKGKISSALEQQEEKLA